jgi:hypothetical protein
MNTLTHYGVDSWRDWMSLISPLMYSGYGHLNFAATGKINSLRCRRPAFELQDDPLVERDAIHRVNPNRVPRDEGHYTFGITSIVFRFDQLDSILNDPNLLYPTKRKI